MAEKKFSVTKNNRDKVGFLGVQGEYLVIPQAVKVGKKEVPVVRVSSNAFQCETEIQTVAILEGAVEEIGEAAFQSCTGITEVVLPASLRSIKKYAFSGCRSLRILSILDGLLNIGQRAFSGCEALDEVFLPTSLEVIGESAFSGCEKLRKVEFSGHALKKIGDSAFMGCKALTEFVVPAGVTDINKWAFNWCDNLVSVTLPDTIRRIEDGAFNGCHPDLQIQFNGTRREWEFATWDSSLVVTKGSIHCLDGDIEV